MATRYEIRTFNDVVRAVLETLKIQSTDTQSINRIKRNINMVYLNHVVPASNSWDWLNDTVSLSVEPYFDGGTASVQQNVSVVELTQAPATSMVGKFFSIDNHNEIYRIALHAANSTTVILEGLYNGATNAEARYKIWSDKVVLPSDCMKVRDVISTNAVMPLQGLSLQQFRKHQVSGGALIGSPSYYCEGGQEDPSPYVSITDLPSIAGRASTGLVKTITFNANITNYVSVGDRIHIECPNSYDYTGDFIVSAVSGADLSYTAKTATTESYTADTSIVVMAVNIQNVSPARHLLVYPSIQHRNQRINLIVDYQKFPSELIADSDEPLIPREHRSVLFFGAMWLSSDRETDLERADRYQSLMAAEIQRMITRGSSTPKTPTIRVSNSYLRTKQGRTGRSRMASDLLFPGLAGGSAGGAPTATGTPNSVAIFDENGYLIGSSEVDLDLLEYLIGTQAIGLAVAVDNTTTILDSFSSQTYKSADIQYIIHRGSSYRAGHFLIVTNGSDVRVTDFATTEIGDTGIEFEADTVGNDMRFKAVADSQSQPATIQYKVSFV